jgi:hypothetical protein
MAQHRQAPRQFKEEPGHDSVSDILFPILATLHLSPTIPWSLLAIGQCGSPVASCPTRIFDRICTQLARDKSISQESRRRCDARLNQETPMLPRSRFPLLEQPWQASPLFQKTACPLPHPWPAGGGILLGLQGGDLFHQQPGLWEHAAGGGARVRSTLPPCQFSAR